MARLKRKSRSCLYESAKTRDDEKQFVIDSSLHSALHSYSGSKERWKRRRKKGMTLEAFKAAVSDELGIQGGYRGPVLSFDYKGGSNPYVNISFKSLKIPALKLKGSKLFERAANVLNIPITNV